MTHQVVLVSPELARCSRCGHEGPWADFPERRDVYASGTGKPQAWCRACRRSYHRERYGARYHRARRALRLVRRPDEMDARQHRPKVDPATGRIWCGECRNYIEPERFAPRDARGVLPSYCREHKARVDARNVRLRRILGG